MDWQSFVVPAAILGGLGGLFGGVLAFASRKFYVETDPRVASIRGFLPGANCGGCGYPGCDGYAEAIVNECARTNLCVAGGSSLAERIAGIMGVESTGVERRVAFVRCKGTPDVAGAKCVYRGAADCREAVILPGGGHKACSFGCLGLGTCVAACAFDAIAIENGIARVDEAKCVGCGACVALCPKGIIQLMPESARTRVACVSTWRGADVRRVCRVGCIGCGLCAKVCPEKAVTVENNLARIDFSKCVHCGLCAEKCPTKAIALLNPPG